MFTFRIRILGSLFTLLLLIVGSGVSTMQRSHAADSKDSKLKQLLTEKLEILQAVVTKLETLHTHGEAGFEELYEAHLAKHRAELDLCESNQEKIAVLEKLLIEAKRRESAAKATKVESSLRVHKAEVDRLDVEIELERLKLK